MSNSYIDRLSGEVLTGYKDELEVVGLSDFQYRSPSGQLNTISEHC